MMYEEIENRMVVDAEWNEIEYGVPSKKRLKRERSTYEDVEMGLSDEK